MGNPASIEFAKIVGCGPEIADYLVERFAEILCAAGAESGTANADAAEEFRARLSAMSIRDSRFRLPLSLADIGGNSDVGDWPCYGHDATGRQTIHRPQGGKWAIVTWGEIHFPGVLEPVEIRPCSRAFIDGWLHANPKAAYPARWSETTSNDKGGTRWPSP